eukprot:m.482740 g.482740  ORF g.482740 m.482740 type:complete len:318 (+) comp21723_c0_seq24:1401-2354(+)
MLAQVSYASSITMWEQFWSHKKHPVVALASTPGPFPVTDPTILALQRYFVWIEPLQQQHLSGVQSMLADSEHTTWVAAHVRAGRDWQLACEKGQGHRKFFSSQQCTLPTGAVTREVCLPTMEEYVDTLVTVAARAGTDVIYIGTDSPAAHSALVAAAAARGAALRFFTSADVHPGATQVNAVLTDQHMFSVASVFIANCISSFSAVAVRHRRITETPRIQPVYFWGLPLDAQYTSLQNPKEEGFFAMFTAPADHLRCKVQLGSIWVCTLAVHTHTHTPSIYSLARIYTPSVSVHIHTHTHTYTLELNHVVSTMLRYL